jgi:Cu/Ag efflux protein CusF
MASTSTSHSTKRSSSNKIESQAKKIMINHPGLAQQAPTFIKASTLKTILIDAKKVAATAHEEAIAIPEISDAELLQMSYMFENKHKDKC